MDDGSHSAGQLCSKGVLEDTQHGRQRESVPYSLYGRSEVEEGMWVLVGLTDRVRTPEVVADQAESLRGLVSLGLVTPL